MYSPLHFYFEVFNPTEETGAAYKERQSACMEVRARSPTRLKYTANATTLPTPQRCGSFLPGERTFFYGTTAPSSHLRRLPLNVSSYRSVRSQTSPTAPKTEDSELLLPPPPGPNHGSRRFYYIPLEVLHLGCGPCPLLAQCFLATVNSEVRRRLEEHPRPCVCPTTSSR